MCTPTIGKYSASQLLKNAYDRRDTVYGELDATKLREQQVIAERDALALREQQALEEIEKLKALLADRQS